MNDRTRRAARMLTDLLDLPNVRPGAWESDHVAALDTELGAILDALTGADDATAPDLHGEVVTMRGEVAELRATVAALTT